MLEPAYAGAAAKTSHSAALVFAWIVRFQIGVLTATGADVDASRRTQGGCFQEGTKYMPVNMPGQSKTTELDASACQSRCEAVSGCAHFSFWDSDGGCHLQGESAVGQADSAGGVAGPPVCSPDASTSIVPIGTQPCWEENTRYEPLDMPGTWKTTEMSAFDCQGRCRQVSGCAHFSFWADGGCHLQSESALAQADAYGGTAGPSMCPTISTTSRTDGACLEEDTKYVPIDMAGQSKTIEVDVLGCQGRCQQVLGCAHFSFWQNDGGCHLQSDSASAESDAFGGVAGSPECPNGGATATTSRTSRTGSQPCFDENTKYVPINMLGQSKTIEVDAHACQSRCHQVSGCAHFSFWQSDGGCHLQGDGATAQQDSAGGLAGPPACSQSTTTETNSVEPRAATTTSETSVTSITTSSTTSSQTTHTRTSLSRTSATSTATASATVTSLTANTATATASTSAAELSPAATSMPSETTPSDTSEPSNSASTLPEAFTSTTSTLSLLPSSPLKVVSGSQSVTVDDPASFASDPGVETAVVNVYAAIASVPASHVTVEIVATVTRQLQGSEVVLNYAILTDSAREIFDALLRVTPEACMELLMRHLNESAPSFADGIFVSAVDTSTISVMGVEFSWLDTTSDTNERTTDNDVSVGLTVNTLEQEGAQANTLILAFAVVGLLCCAGAGAACTLCKSRGPSAKKHGSSKVAHEPDPEVVLVPELEPSMMPRGAGLPGSLAPPKVASAFPAKGAGIGERLEQESASTASTLRSAVPPCASTPPRAGSALSTESAGRGAALPKMKIRFTVPEDCWEMPKLGSISSPTLDPELSAAAASPAVIARARVLADSPVINAQGYIVGSHSAFRIPEDGWKEPPLLD